MRNVTLPREQQSAVPLLRQPGMNLLSRKDLLQLFSQVPHASPAPAFRPAFTSGCPDSPPSLQRLLLPRSPPRKGESGGRSGCPCRAHLRYPSCRQSRVPRETLQRSWHASSQPGRPSTRASSKEFATLILKDTKTVPLKTTCKFPSLQCSAQGHHSGGSGTSKGKKPTTPRKSHLKQLEAIREPRRVFPVPM